MGRSSKLTPEVHDKLVRAVGAGVSIEVAARWVGVDAGTVSRWRTTGRRDCETAGIELVGSIGDDALRDAVGSRAFPYARLELALRRADARPGISAATTTVRAFKNGDWRAAQAYALRTRAFAAEGTRRGARPVTRRDRGASGPGGRPTKLTAEVHSEFVRLIAAGAFASDAATAVGIAESTFHRWMNLGKELLEHAEDLIAAADPDDEGHAYWEIPTDAELITVLNDNDWRYAAFNRDVAHAQATVQVAAVTAWYAAALHDWRAAKAFADARWPERWAAPGDKRKVIAPDEAHLATPSTATTTTGLMTDEERADAIADALRDAGARPPSQDSA